MKSDFLQEFVCAAKPKADIKISDYCANSLYLPASLSVRSGYLRFTDVPWQKQALDLISSPHVNDVAIQSSGQVGKTNIILYLIYYYITHKNQSVLIGQPNEEMARAFNIEKLNHIIKANPKLSETLTNDYLLQKQFGGATVTTVSSQAVASLGMRSVPIVILDEYDSYIIGREGNGGDILDKRTQTYQHRAKRIKMSTPKKNKGESWIERELNNANLYECHFRCLKCNELFIPSFDNVQWQTTEIVDKKTGEITKHRHTQNSWLECPHCHKKHNQAELRRMMRKSTLLLTREHPDKSRIGIHVWQISSPFSSLAEIAGEWVSKNTDDDARRTFKNLTLGLAFEPSAATIHINRLYMQRHEYSILPNDNIAYITAGIDCQTNRVEVEVVAWDKYATSWQLDYRVIFGDLHEQQVWQNLDEYLKRNWQDRLVDCAFIDSGNTDGLTQKVYDFARTRQHMQVYAIKAHGDDRPILPSKPTMIDGCPLFILGSFQLKTLVKHYLAKERGEQGYCHFQLARDKKYFDMFTKDYQVVKMSSGKPVKKWLQAKGANEAFDCRQYALAAMLFLEKEGIFHTKAADVDISLDFSL